MRSLVILAVLSATLALAIDPRDKATDYPVHLKAGDFEYGAEYMVHSVSYRGSTIVVEDYLVVELAIYPPPGREFTVNAQDYMLRINGKKELLQSQTPYMVAASLKYPDWERRPELNVEASNGDRGVILGRPPTVERFPGDQRPGTRRTPNPVPPVSTTPDGVPQEQANPAEIVTMSSLPEGARKTPVGGYLYFAFRGKPKSIKSVDLVIKTASGELVDTRLR